MNPEGWRVLHPCGTRWEDTQGPADVCPKNDGTRSLAHRCRYEDPGHAYRHRCFCDQLCPQDDVVLNLGGGD